MRMATGTVLVADGSTGAWCFTGPEVHHSFLRRLKRARTDSTTQ
jgi:hypothetical protein